MPFAEKTKVKKKQDHTTVAFTKLNTKQYRVFVSTQPFGSINSEPLDILARYNAEVELNPYGRKMEPEEFKKHIADKDILIAGTDRVDKAVLDRAPGLKLIARVGIGIDNIDFAEVKKRGIILTYTPNAVSQAVAELTVANMLNAARMIPQIYLAMKKRHWNRQIGFEISGKAIGLIGFGRVGQRVAKMLQGFSCRILVNDIAPDQETGSRYNVVWATKEEIYSQADIISLHVPHTPLTYNMIDTTEIEMMKPHVCIINTSRGGIINEDALYHALKTGKIGTAAIDVYENEPYTGQLCELDNIILTAHSGSCSKEARYLMELGAAQEVVQFVTGKPPIEPVPDDVIKMECSTHAGKVKFEWHEILNQSQERDDQRYMIYRKHWNQYPTHRIVGPYPLNLDLELVHNPLEGYERGRMLDYFMSPLHPRAKFMEMALFEKVINEIDKMTEPMAIKLGVRGCPTYHPHLEQILRMLKEANCVETIISVCLSQLVGIRKSIFDTMVECGLGVLNIFVDTPAKDDAILDILAGIKKKRSVHKKASLKLRIIGNSKWEDSQEVGIFEDFWSHWADVIALVDPRDYQRKISDRDWDCLRLWQRLTISAEGKILACNYDISEEFCLGQFPGCSIQDAWRGEKMKRLRDVHVSTRETCSICNIKRNSLLQNWNNIK
ncbi:MAG: hypothetical protein FVQ85_04055 [Planctomycetes bacterium]|nr:hypothetical protein [Planctomycetota bacterium]